MADKRKKKILLENHGLLEATKYDKVVALALVLKKFEDGRTLRKVYEPRIIEVLELCDTILEDLRVTCGGFIIEPATRRQLPEPRFKLNSGVVAEPGYYSWVTVLRFAETYLAANSCVESFLDKRETGEHTDYAPDPTPVVSEATSSDLSEVDVPDPIRVGDSQAAYNAADSCVNHKLQGNDVPPDWVKYLEGYNRSTGPPSGSTLRILRPGGGRLKDLIDIDTRGMFLRVNSLMKTSLVLRLRLLSQFYGCPAINDKEMYFLVGRAKFKLSSFSQMGDGITI